MPAVFPLRLLGRLKQDLGNIFYPYRCPACESRDGQEGLCPDCRRQLPVIGPDRCRHCGTRLGPHAGTHNRCGYCRSLQLYFRHTYALCRYDFPVPELIHAYKYVRNFAAEPALKRIIDEGLTRQKVPADYDRVIPAPLFFTDEFKRGFNQAELLARHVGRRLDIQVAGSLRKRRHTPKQVKLQRQERRVNLENAFTCRTASLTGKTVLLVDDVMTTGATLSECARVLKQQGGAKKVDVLVIGR